MTDPLPPLAGQTLDHGAHEAFLDYYARQSLTEATRQRSVSLRDLILRQVLGSRGVLQLDVADVGCGPGTQAMVWAEVGHRVHGLDVSAPFIDLARERARARGLEIDFTVGSATELPWGTETMDVVLAPELLEHVVDWERCIREFCRVVRPNGVLFLSTTNVLCPKQEEFNLPLYSWYPRPLKRRFERLAMTTRPEIANFAKYPAVNWFSYYKLRRTLARLGMCTKDRFDLIELGERASLQRIALHLIRLVPPLRFMAHIATTYTVVLATKELRPPAGIDEHPC